MAGQSRPPGTHNQREAVTPAEPSSPALPPHSEQIRFEASVAGKDYPEGHVSPNEREPRDWATVEAYKPYLNQLRNRPEYAQKLRGK